MQASNPWGLPAAPEYVRDNPIGKIVPISPTQIETWRLCARKFSYVYFSGLPKPAQTKALVIGNKSHKRLEDHFNGHTDYTYDPKDPASWASSKILAAIVPLVPAPGTCEAEQEFGAKGDFEYQGLLFRGKLDWRIPGVEIGDLKTTGNLRYVKSLEELAVHPQPVIYSLRYPGHACHWLYAPTSGGPPVPRRFMADLTKGLDAVLADALEITNAWAKRPKPEDLPPTISACSAYGGCPYQDVCKRTPEDHAKHFFQPTEGTPMDFSQFLTKIATTNEAPPKTDPAPSMDGIAPDADLESIPGVTVSEAFKNAPAAEDQAELERLARMAKAIGTVAASLPVSAEDESIVDGLKAKRTRRTKAQMEADAAAGITKPVRRIAPPEAEQARTEQAAGLAALTSAPQIVTPATIVAPEPAPTVPDLGETSKPIRLLLVDCFSMGLGPVVDFADLAERAHAKVREKMSVADYRYIDFKGAGIMAASIAAEAAALRNAVVILDSRTPEGALGLTALTALSSAVVRGTR